MEKRWKIFIAIFLFFLLDAIGVYILYAKPWMKFHGKNPQFPTTTNITHTQQQGTSIKTYSNSDMHISFNYPSNIQLTTPRPHLVSLANPINTSTDSSLFIFEATITSNEKTVDIPFVIKGKVKKQTPMQIHSFTAKQIEYTNGIIFLTLQKGQQFIMVRIPKDSKGVDEAISDFVDSVKTLQ